MKMIYTNTPDVPGYEIEEILGVITGSVVQSKHIGKDIGAALKTIIGGEIGHLYISPYAVARP